MNEETHEVGKETTSEKTASATADVVTPSTSFEVKSKGYLETFTTLDEANKQVDILRKRAIKKGEPVNIKVSKKHDDGKEQAVRNIKIGRSFFEN